MPILALRFERIRSAENDVLLLEQYLRDSTITFCCAIVVLYSHLWLPIVNW